jgi:hypothetical protein
MSQLGRGTEAITFLAGFLTPRRRTAGLRGSECGSTSGRFLSAVGGRWLLLSTTLGNEAIATSHRPHFRALPTAAVMTVSGASQTGLAQVAWLPITYPNAVWGEGPYASGGARVSAIPKSPWPGPPRWALRRWRWRRRRRLDAAARPVIAAESDSPCEVLEYRIVSRARGRWVG